MKRFLQMVFIAILAAIAVAAVVLVFPAFHKYRSLQKKKHESHQELTQNKTEYIKLKTKLNSLDNKSNQIEKIAREKFNLCKDSELIIKFKHNQIENVSAKKSY